MGEQTVLYHDSLHQGLHQLAQLHPGPFVLFHGVHSYRNLGALVRRALPIARNVVIPFSNPTEPLLQQVMAQTVLEEKDRVVALGGGSVIDSAKLICYWLRTRPHSGTGVRNSWPLIAIPTTCGTGSESTQFATYYKNGIKHSIDELSLLPGTVLLSAEAVQNLPRAVKHHSLADAVCQAIESLWSVRATEQSKAVAQLALKTLLAAIAERSDAKAVQGANLAGQAIQITRTTAAHALSYPLTSRWGIPHGQAVAVFLPLVLKHNARDDLLCQDPRGHCLCASELAAVVSSPGC